jgi:hypothetical protein
MENSFFMWRKESDREPEPRRRGENTMKYLFMQTFRRRRGASTRGRDPREPLIQIQLVL